MLAASKQVVSYAEARQFQAPSIPSPVNSEPRQFQAPLGAILGLDSDPSLHRKQVVSYAEPPPSQYPAGTPEFAPYAPYSASTLLWHFNLLCHLFRTPGSTLS